MKIVGYAASFLFSFCLLGSGVYLGVQRTPEWGWLVFGGVFAWFVTMICLTNDCKKD